MAALVRHKNADTRYAIAERPDFKLTEVQVAVGLNATAINVVSAFLRKAVYEGVGLSPERIEEGDAVKTFRGVTGICLLRTRMASGSGKQTA